MVVIKHDPQLNTEEVKKHYEKEDGVTITYVCSTEMFGVDDRIRDVFYRETPHPKFGNHYFALVQIGNKILISNADRITDEEFCMIEDENGVWHYSACRHDYKAINGCVVDGGRTYKRGYGYELFKIDNGEFVRCRR